MTGSSWTSTGRRHRTRTLLRRTGQLQPSSIMLLARTFALLFFAKLALKLIPVEKIIAWQQRPPASRPTLTGAEALEMNHTIRWAVLVVSRYSPVDFVCFPRCLAASALLKRQGIASRLHYGVTRRNQELLTHTWLEANGEVIIGGEVAGEFSTLAIY